MMNDILIVGNGYDLAKGLNTRFSDFFLPIARQFIIWLENNSNYQPLAPDIENYCYVLKQKFPPLSENIVKNEEEFFNNIFIQITLDRFYPFINLLNSVITVNEQLYKHTVSSNFSGGIITSSPFFNNDDKDYIVEVIRNTTHLLSNRNISSDFFWMDLECLIRDIVADNLTKYPLSTFADLDWWKLYSSVYKVKNNIGYLNNDYYSIITKYKYVSLKKCLHGLNMFKDLFCDYLQKEEKKYRSSAPKKIFLKNKFSHIISLNYTSTFIDSLNNSVPNKEKQEDRICFIHGDRESKNIVIGTESFYFEENSRSETNIEKIPFFKFFQKVLNKTDDKYLQWLEEDEFSLTFFGFSFSQNDFDFIRELIVDDDGNSSSTNHGQVRKNLKSITIYCKTEKDQFLYLVNLAACLGKRHLSSIKSILSFEIIE